MPIDKLRSQWLHCMVLASGDRGSVAHADSQVVLSLQITSLLPELLSSCFSTVADDANLTCGTCITDSACGVVYTYCALHNMKLSCACWHTLVWCVPECGAPEQPDAVLTIHTVLTVLHTVPPETKRHNLLRVRCLTASNIS